MPRRPLLSRLLLWSLPLLVGGGLLVAADRAHDVEALETGRLLLAAGDAPGAAEAFAAELDSPWVGGRAETGHAIAVVLAGDDTGFAGGELAAPRRPPDPGRFPLRVYARGAFDRGDFAGALRLDALADDLGLGSDPVLRTAALIELGQSADARRVWGGAGPAWTPRDAALGARIARYLERPETHDTTLLFDRHGHRLGLVGPDGALTLDEGIDPQLVPNALGAMVAALAPRPGVVRLTLDLELSRAAASALGGYQGSVVLVDPARGDVLAAVSDPRSIRDGATPAFEEMREPASILKLVTTTATQRAGLDPDAMISGWRCPGHVRLDGQMLYCSSPRGPMEGLDHVMAISCNVAFARLGVEIGREALLDELRRYGFDGDLGGFPAGRILQPAGDDRQLGDLAIGLEATSITPLHAALLAATMADGTMPTPTLFAATDGRLGLHAVPLPRPGGHEVVPAPHLPQVIDSMLAVASMDGTAKSVEPPGFEVAMKTGTASDDRYGYHVNYVGIGPMPTPQVAFAVRITGFWSSRQVRGAASIVTRRLLYGVADVARQRGWPLTPVDAYPLPDTHLVEHDAPSDDGPAGRAATSARAAR